jgi:cell division septum initiation protein DivIVA
MENNQNISVVTKLSQKLDSLLVEYEKTLQENLELKDKIEQFESDNQKLSTEISSLEQESSSKDLELESMINKIEKLID